jgi:hypothetical protein
MTRTFLAAGLAALALLARAQQLDIVRWDGQLDSYPLAEVDSLTFRALLPEAAAAREDLRNTQDILLVHTPDGVQPFAVATVDSLVFSTDEVMTVHRRTGTPHSFPLAQVDSLTFASTDQYTVHVVYSGATASVVNPLEALGVAVAVDGSHVTATAAAGLADIHYVLSGASSHGMFKLYSDEPFQLRLDGLDLTNADGPALNIQAHEDAVVELAAGTANVVRDGASYAAAPNGEDQKAALFSEGSLTFRGGGALAIHGLGTAQHGLASDDAVVVEDGQLTVASAMKDGIHTNDGYLQSGGVVAVASASDGIDPGDGALAVSGGSLTVSTPAADKDALKSGTTVAISGGTVQLTVAGNQSKGVNAPEILLSGGALTVQTSGGMVLEASGSGFDPSYCTAVKGDELVRVDGCQLDITATGPAGRGISCDGVVEIASGSVTITSSGNGGTYTNESGVTDAYHGPCLNADGDIVLTGGTITLHHTGSAGKGISGDANLSVGSAGAGPTLSVTTSGAQVNIGGGNYAEAKGISLDSLVTIAGGQLTLTTVDDAIKSKTRIDVNDGLVTIPNTVEGLEAPVIHINGGVVHLTSTDDGINATFGVDGESNDGSDLTINGGYLHLSAPQGDGIDSNGNFTVNGGTILVHGPGAQPEVGLDVNGLFRVNGSTLVVAQINGNMVESPSGTSTQRCVMLRKTSGTYPANTLVHLEDAAGTSLLTFAPVRGYSNILFSSPSITAGTTYRVYTGGTCTGTPQDGLYSGGAYSGGTLRATFTSTSMVQSVNF